MELLSVNRLCAPGSELSIHERWFARTAMDFRGYQKVCVRGDIADERFGAARATHENPEQPLGTRAQREIRSRRGHPRKLVGVPQATLHQLRRVGGFRIRVKALSGVAQGLRQLRVPGTTGP